MTVNGTQKRYLGYTIIGALWGLGNWWFPRDAASEGVGRFIGRYLEPLEPKGLLDQPLLYDLVWSGPWWFLLWLLPVLPIIVIETRASRRPELAAMAVTLCWVAALVAYYAVYAGWLLLGLGGPQLGVRLNQGWEAWWRGVTELRIHQMVGHDFLLYTAVALVGGPIVGWLGGQGMLLLARCWHALRAPRLHAEH